MWGRKEISLRVKIKVFNAIVIPMLFYGAIASTLTMTEERILDVFETDLLKSILGVRWDDLDRNADISDMLRMTLVSLKLRGGRMKWFGHLERMGEERQVKRIMQAEIQGTTLRGKLQTRWKRSHATTTPRAAKSGKSTVFALQIIFC